MAAGRIREQDIDALRERADIVEVISEYVQLKKAGRYMKGLCPFHDEKTPSFSVDPIKQLYHCFGCSEGGNVYSFIMRKEGLEFREAVERLAQRTGFQLHYEGVDQEYRKQEGRKERLVRLHRLAADTYAQYLYAQGGAKARQYLEARGLEEATWKDFGLGYAPAQWDFLYRRAVQGGFTPQEIGESGLFVKGERGVYDRFRDRVIFPIEGTRDEVIGLGGRIIDQGTPKYMNSPETAIYVKSRNLYSLNRARREIMRLGYVIIVEGYTDVIFLWQAGIRNAVATLGTALGEEHFRLLSRLTSRVILAFDADSAGLDASERGLAFLTNFDLDFRVLRLPAGKDPADFARESGKDQFLQLVEESRSIVEFVVEKTLDSFDPTDLATRQRGIEKTINLILSLNVKRLSADDLLKKVADWADSDYRTIQDYFNRMNREKAGHGSGQPKRDSMLTGQLANDVRVERDALGILLQNPWLIDEYYSWLDEDHFNQASSHQLIKAVEAMYEEGKGYDPDRGVDVFAHELIEHLENKESRNLAISLLFQEEVGVEADEEKLQLQLRDLFSGLKDFYLERQIRDLKKELGHLTTRPQRDHELEAGISREIFDLEKQKQDRKKDK